MENIYIREIKSFSRRKGKTLGESKVSLLENFYPSYKIDLNDPISYKINQSKELWLEIGFGTGEHITYLSKLYPDHDFIGCEPFMNGVVSTLHTMKQENINNIRILSDDVNKLLPLLPDNKLSKVFILFPDPWPKKKHLKRRIISHRFLDLLSAKLKSGAIIEFVTDIEDYAEWAVKHFITHKDYNWQASDKSDWENKPAEWVETKYQKKAKIGGRKSYYFHFKKN